MILSKLIRSEEKVIRFILDSLKYRKPVLLTYLNQHCFNIYNKNPEYRNLLDNKFTVFLDGFGVYAALKFLGFKNVEKFNATDLYHKILKKFSSDKTKLFLIGSNFSKEFIMDKAKERMLSVCGYRNGYTLKDDLTELLDNIAGSLPDVIIIGMGVPDQEILATKISAKVNHPVICVGGFLEFYFGTKKRAPEILRKLGLEWVHRLIKEPWRLWKRYLVGIPVFLYHILKIKFLQKSNKN